MLNGKEFNRATRAFALAYEALSVSWLSAFFSWCNKNDLINSLPDNFWSDVGDSLQPHFLKSSIKETIYLSIADVATFLVSLVLGFGGNVTASSDKSDQKLSENDFIKSFSLHQLKMGL
jgi:hypothetical protein